MRNAVVVVTGASAGVGRATARAFARRGARLGLVARGEERLRAAAEEIEAEGGRAIACPADVADYAQVEAVAERVENELGPIDVWVNDAMVTVFSEIKDMTADDFRRVTEVNYLGTVHGTLAALARMLERDRGKIVQVGSALSYRAIPLQSAYCASKFAIRGFTDSLRVELMHQKSGVEITMVQLPALNTPQFSWMKVRMGKHPKPVPPIYEPEVAADAIVFAAENRRREVWVGGRNSVLMFLNKLAPAAGDWYLARTGYDSQFAKRPLDTGRPDNLHSPAPGDYAARGVFSVQAKDHSVELWLTKHRRWLLAAGLLAMFMGTVRRR